MVWHEVQSCLRVYHVLVWHPWISSRPLFNLLNFGWHLNGLVPQPHSIVLSCSAILWQVLSSYAPGAQPPPLGDGGDFLTGTMKDPALDDDSLCPCL